MAGPDNLTGIDAEATKSRQDRLRSGVGVSGSGGGPGSWGAGGWGPGGFGGPGGHGGRGARPSFVAYDPGSSTDRTGPGTSQGACGSHDVGDAILLLLDEWPMPAPQLVRVITQRSGAHWAPDLELVDGGLTALEDSGMVTIAQFEGRDTASLTPSGTSFVDRNREDLGEPWDDLEDAAFATTARLQEFAGATASRIDSSGGHA